MNSTRVSYLCFAFLICISLTARATQTPFCDGLTAKQQKLKKSLFSKLHPYDKCDQTFTRCLAQKKSHPVVNRLANDLCRLIKAGKDENAIKRAFAKRAQSMMPMGKPTTFALDPATLLGNPKAPVEVVIYACSRCPFCKVLVLALHRDVTEGVLKDKVRIYFRPFPLRSHPGSVEGGLATVSAAALGKFWPFLTKLYENFDKFCPKLLVKWATEVGINAAAFTKKMADPHTRKALVASKKEGIRNKVNATPALFINGHNYVYELKHDVVVDVLLEAYESKRKQ